jgi:hypothetical protein
MALQKGFVDAAYLELAAQIVRPVKLHTYERMQNAYFSSVNQVLVAGR